MKWLKWSAIICAALAVALLLAVWIGLPALNGYQDEGQINLEGLNSTALIRRDEMGMPHIMAANLSDLAFAQGFATAQDRMLQMDMTRRMAQGRLSELLGAKTLRLDIRGRTLGFARHAAHWAELLSPVDKAFLQSYADGVNAFLAQGSGQMPLAFKLMGYEPEPWRVEDSLACGLLMAWQSAANIQSEIVALALAEKLGPEGARSIYPLLINPDDPAGAEPGDRPVPERAEAGRPWPLEDPMLMGLAERGPLAVGSNNWVLGPALSAGGKPMVVNDPHLDVRILPGVWYPCGLATEELRAVGVAVPGIPGIVVGRNRHIALGVTNAYGDTQDLYIETMDPADPNRYMEGSRSVPLRIIREEIRVRDSEAPGGYRVQRHNVRLTKRGPLVNNLFKGLTSRRAVSLRWSGFDALSPSLGLREILLAQSAEDVSRLVGENTYLCLNYVFADTRGNIGWRVSGRLPIRSRGDGTMPLAVDGGPDNWVGWVPPQEMPQAMNPARGWLATANNYTVGRDYKYYYTTHASPSWRIRRIAQVLGRGRKMDADGNWALMLDVHNPMAARLAPIMAKALAGYPHTAVLAKILEGWDHQDHPDLAAPLVFQAVYRRFAYLVYRGPLGEELTWLMMDNPYWWQERLAAMVEKGQWSWFTKAAGTEPAEAMTLLMRRAAEDVLAELGQRLDPDPTRWRWGDVHHLIFRSPLRRHGFGADLLGGGDYRYGGSGETLMRAIYDYSKPYNATVTASMRMVADLADDEKVAAILPGGVSGRQFSPHFDDQVKPFVGGAMAYWWFSEKAVEDHTLHTLTLRPR